MLLFGGANDPIFMVGVFISVLVGMTVHEFAHNYVAYLMGDPTPKEQGRLTLDPMVHIYWPGFIMFVLIGFGILGAAPINSRRMRNPRWGYLAAVSAGPFSNLLIAIVAGVIYQLLSPAYGGILYWLLLTMVMFNVLLFLFNLLPLFPLDGWHMVYSLLPVDLAYKWRDMRQNLQFVFMAIILLSFVPIQGFNPLGLLIGEPLRAITELLMGRNIWL